MFTDFMNLIKRIGIFIIVGQTVLHFGIGRKYETYMKLVISLMVAAQVLFAFGTYFKKDPGQTWLMTEEEYYEKWNAAMESMGQAFKEEQRNRECGRVEKGDNKESQKEQGQEETEESKIQIEQIRIR